MLLVINKSQKPQASMITILTQQVQYKLSVLAKHNAVKTYGGIAL